VIVKVQVSVSTSEAVPQVLVYNEDRSVEYTTGYSNLFEALMRADFDDSANSFYKAFFHAHMDGTEIMIDEEAPFQAW